MSRADRRPPKLEPHVDPPRSSPPPTPERVLEQAKVAGRAPSGPGPTEFRRTVERVVAADRNALGALAPLAGLAQDEAWKIVGETFGATATRPEIDATRTIAALRAARARVGEVARTGARIAIATAAPASLLPLHIAFARLAGVHGADLVDLADFGPIRADGRNPRWLRWMGGVAVVTDGQSLLGTRDAEVGREWIFAMVRPALVVADGPFAEVALEQGIEVVAPAGLDRSALALAAARRGPGLIVPMHTDRPARAYRVLEELLGREDPDTERGPGVVGPDLGESGPVSGV